MTSSTERHLLAPAVRYTAAAVAATMALGLAACGGGNKKQADGDRTSASQQHGADTEGLYDPEKLVSKTDPGTFPVKSVRWGLRTGEPATLDPAKVGNDSDYIVSGNLCESLYTVDEMFGLQPNLATEATWSTPKILNITLRDDVKFWNGKDLTSRDVVASLKRTADPESGSVYAGSFVRVKSIKAVDRTHVRVTFTEHDGDFIDTIASTGGRIMEADSIEKLGKDLGTPKGGIVCTGPYTLQKWDAGQSITLKSNPSYWGGEPQVGRVKFIPTQDDAAITSALQTGDLDGAFDIPESATEQLQKSEKGKVYIGPSNSTISIGPTTDHGPAADKRVREALSLAVDRGTLIRSTLRGYGEPASTFTVPFQFQGLEQANAFQAAYDELETPEVDLKRAKELVKEAGAESKTLKAVIPSGDQMLLDVATVVKDAGKKIGLDIKIEQRQASDYAKFFYSPEAREGTDLIVAVGFQDTPGVNTYAAMNALSGHEGLFNWSKYEDPKVTKLLNSARAANTSDQAARDFVAAQKLFADEQLQITLGVQYTRTFMSRKLSGTTTSIAYISTPWAKDLGGTEEP